ncbi:hypothetical protein APHAL10511_002780 [Amanita phalloides]|nr:hypothetical protein APHAL10511_002780 [Amanita phalloides]
MSSSSHRSTNGSSFSRAPCTPIRTPIPKTTPKRILVIDGGGMRGLASLLVIDAIMKEITKKTGRSLLPCQVFDLLCGTSVGGFVSILIGRLGLDCQAAINIYETVVKTLFRDDGNIWKNIANAEFLDTTKFDTYLAQKMGEIAGSPHISMKLHLYDDEEPRHRQSSKTIVTVMEDAPEYPSYTHIIGSYKRDSLLARAGHYWTVSEVIRATIASPIYLSPISIKTDKIRCFQDAGFCGYNNPIDIASSELENVWPNERIGSVISLGTGLRDFLPENLPKSRAWGPIPSYVSKVSDDVCRERLCNMDKHTEIETNVRYAVRQLARIAADSRISHQDFEMKRTSLCDNYYRIDEPFGLDRFDLIDVFKADIIKLHMDEWLKAKAHFMEELVDKLGIESGPPVTKEAAQTMKPPAPPIDTVRGYNPVMDKPRPCEMYSYLRNYDVLFVVDDSGSMGGAPWDEARDALHDIAEYAFDLKVRSVNLRFLNNPSHDRGLQGASALGLRFNSVRPGGVTPTGAVLDAVLTDHLNKVDRTMSDPAEYSKIPPLDIIVLTDGQPTDNPADTIAKAVKRLKNSKYHPNTMGIQFVQIGNAPDARLALKALVKGDNGSIVDTVPYRGKVTSEKLQRILLGALHPNVRAMVPDHWLAVD